MSDRGVVSSVLHILDPALCHSCQRGVLIGQAGAPPFARDKAALSDDTVRELYTV